VTVRRAVPADGPRILELDRQLARFEKLEPPSDAEGRKVLAWIFESGKLEAFVAEVGGRIEGIALFYETPGSTFRARPFVYLEDLVVAEDSRSRGVGEALMVELAREAVRRNAWRVEWSVLDWNVHAMRFYDRLGGESPKEWRKYALEGEALARLAAQR
jgi:ribosomal protein S18 acetylase RimI-like enzyme